MKTDFNKIISKAYYDKQVLKRLKQNHNLQYNKVIEKIVHNHFGAENMKPRILSRVEQNGYVTFERGQYNLNIIGVRTSSRVANKFDDWLYVVYKDESDEWVQLKFQITTDPGTYWLENPSRVAGTAILVADQYRGSHKIGLHKNESECKSNKSKYIDNNRNDILNIDPDIIQEDILDQYHRAMLLENQHK